MTEYNNGIAKNCFYEFSGSLFDSSLPDIFSNNKIFIPSKYFQGTFSDYAFSRKVSQLMNEKNLVQRIHATRQECAGAPPLKSLK